MSDAKRCEQCGEYYDDAPQFVVSNDVFMGEGEGAGQSSLVDVTIHSDGLGTLDLCRKCTCAALQSMSGQVAEPEVEADDGEE